jgi:hypothetical protein
MHPKVSLVVYQGQKAQQAVQSPTKHDREIAEMLAGFRASVQRMKQQPKYPALDSDDPE